ncbi:MAG: hypothetical protein ACYTG1_11900 [Planctomycetota bacterium]|jgi:hypothetical protein
MSSTKGALACIVLASATATALAGGTTTTFTETFDGGSNEGSWTWGAGDSTPAAGGNPGAYLRTDGLDTFAPQPRTQAAVSEFTGDYRAQDVSAIGVDLVTLAAATTGGRPATLMLIHDNDTPGDPFDDTAAYFMAANIPAFGEGWVSYDYVVPSQETTLPAGWLLLNLGDSGAPANHTWDEVMQDVSEVRFFYGDPTFFFIFQQWTLGLDNVRITKALPCPADVDGSGDVEVNDLLAVLAAWGTCPGGQPCPEDVTGDLRVLVDDLLAVLGAWGGC